MKREKNIELKTQYVNYLAGVPSHKFASMSIKKDQGTVKRWRDKDPDFAYQCRQAISAFVYRNVKKAKPEFRLERLLREDFSQRLEHDITGKLKVEVIGEFLSTRKKAKGTKTG